MMRVDNDAVHYESTYYSKSLEALFLFLSREIDIGNTELGTSWGLVIPHLITNVTYVALESQGFTLLAGA
jgi:hypothetical protein